ncbi:DUF2892 domain-containing protein [Thalassospira sp. MA62]|nr:DUF2892 domain-containing protein [Thalassospira sp. MA62]
MNVGTVDRLIRAIVGIVLLALPFVMANPEQGLVAYGMAGWVIAAVGVVMLLTAALRFCPMYRLLGIKTCKLPR